MARIDEQTKRQRKDRVQLIVASANGLRESEVAAQAGLEPRTVNNYLHELEYEGHVFKDGLLWFALNVRGTKLRSFELSPEEAYTLYLAARLLVKQHDKRNEPAETALLKLAKVLSSDLGVGNEIAQAAAELAQRPMKAGYQSVFRTVVQGYLYRRQIDIVYRPYGGKPFATVFSPYLLEPSAIGFTTYAIGHSSLVSDLRSYRLDRIESAQIKRDAYQIPANFPGLDILRNAWSIIIGETTTRVILRFSPAVKERVLETRWHPSQDSMDDPDKPGYLRWWVDVADTTDMKPWVRSWGADCDVLEPDTLRAELAAHAGGMASMYGVLQPPLDAKAWQLLWAKADRKTGAYHRLPYHMIDVGLVAQVVWNRSLHPRLKQDLADWFHLTVDETGRLVAFLACLHDLGKASPAFQDHPRMPTGLRERIMGELRSTGLSFANNRPPAERRARHEVISTWALRPVDGEQLLCNVCGFPESVAGLLAQALGGHHGTWPPADRFGPAKLTRNDKGGPEWSQARADLIAEMKEVFQPPVIAPFEADTGRDNVMLALLSASVSAADWIGSDETNFPLESSVLPLATYVRHARQHAKCAVARVGWEPPANAPEFAFQRVFPFDPNDTQKKIMAALGDTSLPALAIIEAPMGVGKTEAAFAVYADWARRNQSAGIYVAMPTTATSNQMHDRTTLFLTKLFGSDVEPLLVHGQALLRDLPEPGDPVEETEHEGNSAAGQAWFLPRKKSLLAPYGVGTVDQALMSILQTKHFFVRLLGLAHKVVIFDEVHAYDAYMSELFERLLIWLRAVGASVIVLSATLPEKTRRKLVATYAGGKLASSSLQYPRLTVVDAEGDNDASVELPRPPSRWLQFEWIPQDQVEIIKKLKDLMKDGGCATVICNTVTRAQKLFQALRDLPPDEQLCDEDNLILFHARFPMAWREEIERKVLVKFDPGPEKNKPNPHRPSRAIVVATQVIEQSLDLDFDVMISDHAPIDLLLQRSGRLQRHSKNDPRSHPNCLWIAVPATDQGVPEFDRSDKYVYDEYVLLRTWLALRDEKERKIDIPNDVAGLIELVYGDKEPDTGIEMKAALARAKATMTMDEFGDRAKARRRRIQTPDDEELIWGDNLELEEDDPTVHEIFQAMTRSDRPGLSIVCLHRVDGLLYLDPDDLSSRYDPTVPLDKRMIRDLARQTVTIRRRDVEKLLLAEPRDEQIRDILTRWRRIAALRYHRVVIFDHGKCRLYGTSFVLELNKDSKLGLQICKEEQ